VHVQAAVPFLAFVNTHVLEQSDRMLQQAVQDWSPSPICALLTRCPVLCRDAQQPHIRMRCVLH
jgi:hypothetical protein